MNHNFPCTPEGGKISQLNPIIDYYKSMHWVGYIISELLCTQDRIYLQVMKCNC